MDKATHMNSAPKKGMDPLVRYRMYRRSKDRKHFKQVIDYAKKEFNEDPDAYLCDYYRRKAKAGSGPLVLGTVVVILVNLGWQAIAAVMRSMDSTIIGADTVVIMDALLFFVGFAIFFLTVFVLYLALSTNRQRNMDLMIEEHYLRKTGRLV